MKMLNIENMFPNSKRIDLSKQNEMQNKMLIIRNITFDEASNLKDELSRIGISEIHDMQAKNSSHQPKLIRAICEDDKIRNRLIQDGILINNQKFRTEPFITLPKQCMKCKEFGHISRNCNKPHTVCGNCSGDHLESNCTNINALKCPNCEGNHNAFHRGCQKFKDIKQQVYNNIKNKPRSNSVQNKTSYANIVSQQEQFKQINQKITSFESSSRDIMDIKGKVDKIFQKLNEIDGYLESRLEEMISINNSKIVILLESVFNQFTKSNNNVRNLEKDTIRKLAKKINLNFDDKLPYGNLNQNEQNKTGTKRAGFNSEQNNEESDENNRSKKNKSNLNQNSNNE